MNAVTAQSIASDAISEEMLHFGLSGASVIYIVDPNDDSDEFVPTISLVGYTRDSLVSRSQRYEMAREAFSLFTKILNQWSCTTRDDVIRDRGNLRGVGLIRELDGIKIVVAIVTNQGDNLREYVIAASAFEAIEDALQVRPWGEEDTIVIEVSVMIG